MDLCQTIQNQRVKGDSNQRGTCLDSKILALYREIWHQWVSHENSVYKSSVYAKSVASFQKATILAVLGLMSSSAGNEKATTAHTHNNTLKCDTCDRFRASNKWKVSATLQDFIMHKQRNHSRATSQPWQRECSSRNQANGDVTRLLGHPFGTLRDFPMWARPSWNHLGHYKTFSPDIHKLFCRRWKLFIRACCSRFLSPSAMA